jgi:hypothetical protein
VARKVCTLSFYQVCCKFIEVMQQARSRHSRGQTTFSNKAVLDDKRFMKKGSDPGSVALCKFLALFAKIRQNFAQRCRRFLRTVSGYDGRWFAPG